MYNENTTLSLSGWLSSGERIRLYRILDEHDAGFFLLGREKDDRIGFCSVILPGQDADERASEQVRTRQMVEKLKATNIQWVSSLSQIQIDAKLIEALSWRNKHKTDAKTCKKKEKQILKLLKFRISNPKKYYELMTSRKLNRKKEEQLMVYAAGQPQYFETQSRPKPSLHGSSFVSPAAWKRH